MSVNAENTGYSLCKNLILAIKKDAALQSFCLKQFEKLPVFFQNIDTENPPKAEDLPFIMVSLDQTSGNPYEPAEHSIFLGTAIEDKRKLETEFIKNSYLGNQTSEIFAAIAYNAVNQYVINQQQQDVEIDITDHGNVSHKPFYPYFNSGRVLKIITKRNE